MSSFFPLPSVYLFLFPTYLPPPIYFLVESRPLRTRETYGWLPLTDTSLGKSSPASWPEKTHHLRNKKVLHANSLSKGKAGRSQEMPTGGRQRMFPDFVSRNQISQPMSTTEKLSPVAWHLWPPPHTLTGILPPLQQWEALQRKQRRNQHIADTHTLSELEGIFEVSKFNLLILQKDTLRLIEKENDVK